MINFVVIFTNDRIMGRKSIVFVCFSFFIFSFSLLLFSQKPVKISRHDFKVAQEGFKTAWDHLQKGDELFRRGEGGYPLALEHYLLAYRYNSTDPGLNYRIGVCYLHTDHKDKALSYLEAAYAADSILSQDILYLLGRAHQYRYEFDEALRYYRAFIQGPGYVPTVPLAAEARKHIRECEDGKVILGDTVPAKIVDMGPEINSPADDYKAVLSPGGDKLYFTSRRKLFAKQLPNRYDGKYEEDIYVSIGEGNGWSAAVRLEKPVNTRYNDAALALSPDGQELFVYNGKKGNGDILSYRQKKGHWSKAVKVMGKINSRWQ